MTKNSKILCLAVAVLFILTVPAMAVEKELSKTIPLDHQTQQLIGGNDEAFDSGTPNFAPATFAPPPNPPGDTVGTTYYEYQHNGTMGRQVAYAPSVFGTPYVHFVWMCRTSPTGTRTIYYNSRNLSLNSWVHGSGVGSGQSFTGANGGYTTMDVNANGQAVAAWHEGGANYFSHVASDKSAPAPIGTFGNITLPGPPNCQGYVSADGYELTSNYIWPVVDYDLVGGDSIYHVISSESPEATAPAATIQSYIYYRLTNDALDACSSPTDTLGLWIDEAQNITPLVRSDPNSDKVAIVWLKELYADGDPNNDCPDNAVQWKHDVVYMESTDGGVSWGSVVNVTDYTQGNTLKMSELPYSGYTDLTALYDHLGNLHIVWNTPVWQADGTCGILYQSMLWHWDDLNQAITPVYDATLPNSFYPGNFGNCPNTGSWNIMVSKPNISECDDNLYVTFTRFGGHPDTTGTGIPNDSIGGDFSDDQLLNGDIYLTASSDGGITWGPDAAAPAYQFGVNNGTGTAVKKGTAVNLTNTYTQGCAAGDCHSEHWATMAKYSTGVVHIEYIDDNDAGGAVGVEPCGDPTNNAVMWTTYDCFVPEGTFGYSVNPTNAFVPIAPNGAADCTIDYTDDLTITVRNTGNVPIDYTSSGDQTWINGTPSGTITAGINPSADLVFTIGTIAAEGEYNGTITIDLTSTAGNATVVVNVTAHVECKYYVPEYSLISTACWSVGAWNVPRAGIAQRGDAGNMWWFLDSIAPMYDEGLILTYASDVGQTFFSMFDGSDSNASFIAMGPLTTDATGTYEHANGIWGTPDSVITGTIDWYVPLHPATCVLIERVHLCNNSASPVTIHLGEGIDWDFPDGNDPVGSDNASGVDATRQMVYQSGPHGVSPEENYYGGASFCQDIVGAIVLENDVWVYPNSGYIPSEIGNLLATHTGFVATDSVKDLSSVYVIAQNMTLEAAACTTFCKVKTSVLTGLTDLQNLIDAGKQFIKDTPEIDCPGCAAGAACLPGDADGSGGVDIDDVVYLINYIFGGGPEPVENVCCGDADGSGAVDIDDVVYLINYIFGGGPAPVDIC